MRTAPRTPEQELAACLHCGLPVRGGTATEETGPFCCQGCRTVYELLHEKGLHPYYTIAALPGRTATPVGGGRFAYLDDAETVARIREFSDGSTGVVTLTIPGMHCAACIWLLEQLHTLDAGILHSRVDFLKKLIRISYAEQKTSLRRIVELLASLGYEPLLTLDAITPPEVRPDYRPLYYRIGIAGFSFGNIMLLSFPEYLGGNSVDPELQLLFRWLGVLLALPVVFYSASGYFRSAYAALRKRVVGLDFPLALGIAILFGRSLAEIILRTGPGYLDSMSGLVLFLLIGRLFQNVTHDRLNFERDYRSYFPLSVLRLLSGREETIPVSRLRPGDRILLRNGEIAPADSVLMKGRAAIDYSFVTGESHPVDCAVGAVVQAGGRQTGGAVELEVVAPVSESYLARLWKDTPRAEIAEAPYSALANAAGKTFTAALLLLSGFAAILWMPGDPARGWNAITAILIVACPCAIALAVPFAFGTAFRILGEKGFYLKNTGVVESLARITSIVFDKTGTITRAGAAATSFVGEPLTGREERLVASLVRNSHHPLSRAIGARLHCDTANDAVDFDETSGQGIAGLVEGTALRLGSAGFALGAQPASDPAFPHAADTRVFLSIEGIPRGHFAVRNVYREGFSALAQRLKRHFRLHLLSGDTPAERFRLREILGPEVPLLFHQSPPDKREFIRSLRQQGARVAMVGDGLNDAAALTASDAGIAITEEITAFSPACDAILEAHALARLDDFFAFAASAVRIVIASFGLSAIYNIIGLTFAFTGTLSPLVAAILMPVSSVSIIAFTTLSVRAVARRRLR